MIFVKQLPVSYPVTLHQGLRCLHTPQLHSPGGCRLSLNIRLVYMSELYQKAIWFAEGRKGGGAVSLINIGIHKVQGLLPSSIAGYILDKVGQGLWDFTMIKVSIYYEECTEMPCLQVCECGINEVTIASRYFRRRNVNSNNNDDPISRVRETWGCIGR